VAVYGCGRALAAAVVAITVAVKPHPLALEDSLGHAGVLRRRIPAVSVTSRSASGVSSSTGTTVRNEPALSQAHLLDENRVTGIEQHDHVSGIDVTSQDYGLHRRRQYCLGGPVPPRP
jgi:hypothetical protein